MKRAILALLLTACAVHMTAPRAGWNGCTTDGRAVSCRGKPMAQLECLAPSAHRCGALAIVYTGGERVFLYRPPGFDPAQPADTGGGAVQPQIASDANLIWFRDGDIRGDEWHVYDPQSGIMQVKDAMGVSLLRQAGSIPIGETR